jgi:hypothetical protein
MELDEASVSRTQLPGRPRNLATPKDSKMSAATP